MDRAKLTNFISSKEELENIINFLKATSITTLDGPTRTSNPSLTGMSGPTNPTIQPVLRASLALAHGCWGTQRHGTWATLPTCLEPMPARELTLVQNGPHKVPVLFRKTRTEPFSVPLLPTSSRSTRRSTRGHRSSWRKIVSSLRDQPPNGSVRIPSGLYTLKGTRAKACKRWNSGRFVHTGSL